MSNQIKRSKYPFNENSIKQIEFLLPRLKHSLPPSKIIKWLENFFEQDVSMAINLLLALEYIPFAELQYRLNEQLEKALNAIPKCHNIIIIPYGKFGKSGTLMSYPVLKSSAFVNRSKKTTLTFDYANLKVKRNSHIIFIDDFVGTGDSFVNSYDTSITNWIKRNKIKSESLVVPLIMLKGRKAIQANFQHLKIYGEDRDEIFNRLSSPLRYFGDVKKYQNMVLKYPLKRLLGYKNSEAHIAFNYGAPNNTSSIIWSDDKWFPIYPKRYPTRADQAKAVKKDVAFYIGILNRKELDTEFDKKINLLLNTYGSYVYDPKVDHSLILLIMLNKERWVDMEICQLMGITLEELKEIYIAGKKRGFFDKRNKITTLGDTFFLELSKQAKLKRFRSDIPANYRIRDSNYIPLRFMSRT